MVTGLFFQGCICVPGLNGDLTGGKAEASCGKGAGILVSPTSALQRDGLNGVKALCALCAGWHSYTGV